MIAILASSCLDVVEHGVSVGLTVNELVREDGTRSPLTFPGPARHGHACLSLDDGSALVIGGLDAAGRPLGDVWRYTPE